MLEKVEAIRSHLEKAINQLIAQLGEVPIGKPGQLPLGWGKAAKGRTIWRLAEELVTQNLKVQHQQLNITSFEIPESEVGVYDFRCSLLDGEEAFVNIKTSLKDGPTRKDDISKAIGLETFFEENPHRVLLIATVEIEFDDNPQTLFRLVNCSMVPVTWLPDIYVNYQNRNLQSSKYKNINLAVRRDGNEFLKLLRQAMEDAKKRKREKEIKDSK